MRKKKIAALSLVIFLASSSLVYAEGKYQMIEVFWDKISVKLNGQALSLPKNSIIHNGTVYVPLRSLSELIGADVSWDADERMISLDFLQDDHSVILDDTKKGMYQYIAIQKNLILTQMTKRFKQNDMDGMKEDILAFGKLKETALNIGDNEIYDILDKMMASAELLRSGWNNKATANYAISWEIFEDNTIKLQEALKKRLDPLIKEQDILRELQTESEGQQKNN